MLQLVPLLLLLLLRNLWRHLRGMAKQSSRMRRCQHVRMQVHWRRLQCRTRLGAGRSKHRSAALLCRVSTWLRHLTARLRLLRHGAMAVCPVLHVRCLYHA